MVIHIVTFSISHKLNYFESPTVFLLSSAHQLDLTVPDMLKLCRVGSSYSRAGLNTQQTRLKTCLGRPRTMASTFSALRRKCLLPDDVVDVTLLPQSPLSLITAQDIFKLHTGLLTTRKHPMGRAADYITQSQAFGRGEKKIQKEKGKNTVLPYPIWSNLLLNGPSKENY